MYERNYLSSLCKLLRFAFIINHLNVQGASLCIFKGSPTRGDIDLFPFPGCGLESWPSFGTFSKSVALCLILQQSILSTYMIKMAGQRWAYYPASTVSPRCTTVAVQCPFPPVPL